MLMSYAQIAEARGVKLVTIRDSIHCRPLDTEVSQLALGLIMVSLVFVVVFVLFIVLVKAVVDHPRSAMANLMAT